MKCPPLKQLLNSSVFAVALLALSTTSCETNAKTGALAGAAAGAAIGATRGNALKGAAIGAAAGAATGYVIKARRYKNTGGEPTSSYPYARSSGESGVVLSPYGGHKVDVKGFSRDELAIDPKTNKIFRVP